MFFGDGNLRDVTPLSPLTQLSLVACSGSLAPRPFGSRELRLNAKSSSGSLSAVVVGRPIAYSVGGCKTKEFVSFAGKGLKRSTIS